MPSQRHFPDAVPWEEPVSHRRTHSALQHQPGCSSIPPFPARLPAGLLSTGETQLGEHEPPGSD